jgi:hypothetical protein
LYCSACSALFDVATEFSLRIPLGFHSPKNSRKAGSVQSVKSSGRGGVTQLFPRYVTADAGTT